MENSGEVVDSGACAAGVGNITLSKPLIGMKVQAIPDATPTHKKHRSGDHPDPQLCSQFGVKGRSAHAPKWLR